MTMVIVILIIVWIRVFLLVIVALLMMMRMIKTRTTMMRMKIYYRHVDNDAMTSRIECLFLLLLSYIYLGKRGKLHIEA